MIRPFLIVGFTLALAGCSGKWCYWKSDASALVFCEGEWECSNEKHDGREFAVCKPPNPCPHEIRHELPGFVCDE